MEISQADRDKLREKQQSLSAKFTIGNLVEHKIQDPKQYKSLSRQEDGSNSGTAESEEFAIAYQSKYLPSSAPMKTVQEDQELEMPISTEEVQKEMWLNMDNVEFEKLEWMTSKAEKLQRDQIKGSTRFGKDGRVINEVEVKQAKNGDQGSGIEGHDLDSLVKLLDSTYQPQVIYSLNVIARIASYATMGYYDGTFDENIHQLLLKNCLLRVRHRLDSTNETICQSAIKCLRALLCNNQVDEVILDRINPIIVDFTDPNLWLETMDMASKEFTIEMKDIECVEIDAIKALVERTDLLTRFNHLLNTKTGNFGGSCYDCILDILIRVARHSAELACLINQKELMQTVIKNFLPSALTTENEAVRPLSTKALKLVRLVTGGIMSLEAQKQPIPLHRGASNRLPASVIPALTSYLAIDCLGSISSGVDDMFKLHLEALRCLNTFSRFRQFKEDVNSLIAMNRDKIYVGFQAFSKLQSTKPLGSKISFDWQYVAHLIDLNGSKNKNDLNHPSEQMKASVWSLFAKPLVFRWLNDISREKIVPHIDVSIAIAAALKHYKDRINHQNASELQDHLIGPIMKGREENGTRSPNIFKVLARAASQNSQLSRSLKTSGRLRDPTNLPSYGWLLFNSEPEHQFKLDPLFETDSPYFLLDVYLTQLDSWNPREPEALNIFLGVDIMRYLRSISGYQKQPLEYETFVQQSYSAQFEIRQIVKTILLMSKCYISLPEPQKFADLDTRLEEEKYEFRYDDFGNLCYYAVSTVGLLYDNCSSNLKDEIFKRLLLNEALQSKINYETLKHPSCQKLVSPPFGDVTDLSFVSTKQINILSHIYDCCIPVDRFWIFQPILLFYIHVLKESEGNQSERMKDPKWLVKNMPWRTQASEVQSNTDAALMSAILNFNYKLMSFSAAYKQFIIIPNVEDYICMVGVVFLHDDIFLDGSLTNAIAANIKSILDVCEGGNTDWIKSLFKDASRKIEQLELPLADFFNQLVDQYEAVSYGHEVFTNLLLLFLSPYADKSFRKKFFQEKLETCVRQLRIDTSEVWSWERIYFTQKESDDEIRELYQRAKKNAKPGTFLQQFLEFHTN